MSWIGRLNDAAGGKKPVSEDERKKIASDLVMMSSMGAAAVALVPVPLSDFVLVTPVQASMVMAVGRVFGRKLDLSESKHILLELASVCGLGLVAQKGFATLTKLFLPGLGGFLAGPYAFAVTYGMGHVAIRYFQDKESTRESLKRVYEQAVAEGKKVFSKEKLDEFRKKRGKEVADFATQEAAEPPAQAPKKAPRRSAPKRKSPRPG